jgi:hypothetical protein
MKRFFKRIGAIGFIAAFCLIFAGCGTVGGIVVSHTFLMDGALPIEYFQEEKAENERLVYLSPVLLPDQSDSYLYIITNPEDVEKAQAKLNSQEVTSFAAANKALSEFSPIFIKSSSSKVILGSHGIVGNGMAIFHLPADTESLFYAYLRFGKNAELSLPKLLMYTHDVLPLSSLPENVFMGFSDGEKGFEINTVTDPAEIEKIYYGTRGNYATYLTSGSQTASSEDAQQLGFSTARLHERIEYARLTREEFEKIELAYAETVRYIEEKGKRISVDEATRQDFMQTFQGRPNAAQVTAAKHAEHNYQRNLSTSEQEIVVIAKNEPDAFKKVRIIHDWVADLFYYDMDLLRWMDKNGQAHFTLAEITQRMRGVCFEYGILFWNLMDAVGIDTYLICDYSEPGIGHAYNMVVIDGTGYIVDTTWDSGNQWKNGKVTSSGGMSGRLYCMPDIAKSYELRGW